MVAEKDKLQTKITKEQRQWAQENAESLGPDFFLRKGKEIVKEAGIDFEGKVASFFLKTCAEMDYELGIASERQD